MGGWDSSVFEARLARVEAILQPAVEVHLLEAGMALINDAGSDPNFPYKTGSLRGSGKTLAPQTSGTRTTVMVGYGGTSDGFPHDPVTYEAFVHNGTPRMPARPYFGVPFVQMGPQRLREAGEAVLADVKEAWG